MWATPCTNRKWYRKTLKKDSKVTKGGFKLFIMRKTGGEDGQYKRRKGGPQRSRPSWSSWETCKRDHRLRRHVLCSYVLAADNTGLSRHLARCDATRSTATTPFHPSMSGKTHTESSAPPSRCRRTHRHRDWRRWTCPWSCCTRLKMQRCSLRSGQAYIQIDRYLRLSNCKKAQFLWNECRAYLCLPMLRLAVDTLSSLLAYGKDWRSCIKNVYGKASCPPTCNFFTYDVVRRASAATVMAMTFGYEYPAGRFATLAEDIAGGVTSVWKR